MLIFFVGAAAGHAGAGPGTVIQAPAGAWRRVVGGS